MKILTFIILFLTAGSLFADVPNEITYSGRLREYGQPINAKRTLNFKIYTTADDIGMVWESGDVEVLVTSGIFTYKLTPNVDWRLKDLWIETVVSGKILKPREKITSQVYSLHSRTSEDIEKTAGSSINFKIGSETKSKIDTSGEFANFIGGTTYYTVPRLHRPPRRNHNVVRRHHPRRLALLRRHQRHPGFD